jgi:hypothetical protein
MTMKIDPKELAQVAAAPTPPRVDLYAGIHKAMRALMADTLLALGRMDTEDDLETAQTCHRVMELLDFCRSHLLHENEFVHPAIEARSPGASELVAHEHEEHEQAITALGVAVAGLLAGPRAHRAMAGLDLYRRLALFVAHNLEHMHVEETAHNAVLWSRHTDAELLGIHNALVAALAPAEMMYVLRWMVPFMNPAERLGMLGDMQRQAPPQAFQAALDVVQPHLTSNEWAKLARDLGLAPAPGLVDA